MRSCLVAAAAVILCGGCGQGKSVPTNRAYLELLPTYAGTTGIEVPPVITGDPSVDDLIVEVAVDRGFALTRLPARALVSAGDHQLQPAALRAWNALSERAARDSIPVSLVSGFRSVEEQRALFLTAFNRLGGAASSRATTRSRVEAVLLRVAPPGFSRHHTGYTIDVGCDDGSNGFAGSDCDEWVRANGYRRANEAGWWPSYDGKHSEGPEPEPWEFYWRPR